MPLSVTVDDVRAAARRIAGGVVRTPAARSRALSLASGADVILKREMHQTTGSYKERGALNTLLQLTDDERARGVITMSAGNHAQAVAYHGTRLGVATTVVMPQTTPFLKIRRTRDFGATVLLTGDTLDDAAAMVRERIARTGETLLHPFDDPRVIAGQGTATLELLEDAGDLDVLLVPVGGGGLIAGATLALEALGSRAQIIAVQSAAYPSIGTARGEAIGLGGPTIAEGIAVKQIGELPLAIIAGVVHEVISVEEAALEAAIVRVLEDDKLVVEGAGVAGIAALLGAGDRFAGLRVGTILCGGNIDPGVLASVIVRQRLRSGRVMRLRVHAVDRPGELARVATLIGEQRANVLEVVHQRVFAASSARHAELDLTIELEQPGGIDPIFAALAQAGFTATLLRE